MYSILVNSTDRYSDCWTPFFILLNKYWKNSNTSIYLNCENKSFNFDGINIKMIRNIDNYTWSQCLMNAIDNIDSRIVLYMQDDYFINSIVDQKSIDDFIKLMTDNPEIKTIGLTKFGSPASNNEYVKDKRLMLVKQNAKYRISMQAALWDKECLKSYLKLDENGWMFEIFGSGRARKRKDLFLTISESHFKEKATINYIHTGIIKGKWHMDIPEFFSKEGITIDFSKRGTIDPSKNRFVNKFQTYKKLISKPTKLKYFLP